MSSDKYNLKYLISFCIICTFYFFIASILFYVFVLLYVIFQIHGQEIVIKLNAGRAVTGVLRGFDPFMNLVLDESVEETKDGQRNNIGMVVCTILFIYPVESQSPWSLLFYIIVQHLDKSMSKRLIHSTYSVLLSNID